MSTDVHVTATVDEVTLTGAASEVTLAAALAQLEALSGFVDGLEGNTDGIEAKLDQLHTDLLAVQGYVDGLEGLLTTLDAKDFATQATLAAVLAKITADPATQTTLAAVLAKLSSDPATQTTSAAILSELQTIDGHVDGVEGLLGRLPSGGAASEATLDAIQALIGTAISDSLLTLLRDIKTNTASAVVDIAQLELTADQVQLNTDAVETKLDTLHADLAALATDAHLQAFVTATHTDLAAILAKLSADPATQTTLAAVLAKLSSDPSTGAGQTTQSGKLDTLHTDLGTLNAKDFATQTTLAAVLAKLIAAPATEAKQDSLISANHTDLAAILAKNELIRALLAGTLVVERASDTATLTNVTSAATNATALAANTSRKAWSVFNDSTAVLYIKYGATASTTSYTVQIPAGGYYESGPVNYRGKIDCIWASANGSGRFTELT